MRACSWSTSASVRGVSCPGSVRLRDDGAVGAGAELDAMVVYAVCAVEPVASLPPSGSPSWIWRDGDRP